jgi:hypothetical protein
VSDNVLDVINYDSKSSSLDARYVFNIMNEVFYATECSMLTTILTQSIQQDINLAYTNETISGRTNGFAKLQFGYQKRVPFKSSITGILKRLQVSLLTPSFKVIKYPFLNLVILNCTLLGVICRFKM